MGRINCIKIYYGMFPVPSLSVCQSGCLSVPSVAHSLDFDNSPAVTFGLSVATN